MVVAGGGGAAAGVRDDGEHLGGAVRVEREREPPAGPLRVPEPMPPKR